MTSQARHIWHLVLRGLGYRKTLKTIRALCQRWGGGCSSSEPQTRYPWFDLCYSTIYRTNRHNMEPFSEDEGFVSSIWTFFFLNFQSDEGLNLLFTVIFHCWWCVWYKHCLIGKMTTFPLSLIRKHALPPSLNNNSLLQKFQDKHLQADSKTTSCSSRSYCWKPAGGAHLLHADAGTQIEAGGSRKCDLTFAGPACEAVLNKTKDHEGNGNYQLLCFGLYTHLLSYSPKAAPDCQKG